MGSFWPTFGVAFWLSTDRICGDCRTRVPLSLKTACNIPDGKTVEKSEKPILPIAESGREDVVAVVVPVVLVPLVEVLAVLVDVDVVPVEELGVLILDRGVKLTGRLSVFRAAPRVRVISLDTCNTMTSTTTSDLGLSRS